MRNKLFVLITGEFITMSVVFASLDCLMKQLSYELYRYAFATPFSANTQVTVKKYKKNRTK